MDGSATFTIVTSSSSMNVARQTERRVHHLLMPPTYLRRADRSRVVAQPPHPAAGHLGGDEEEQAGEDDLERPLGDRVGERNPRPGAEHAEQPEHDTVVEAQVAVAVLAVGAQDGDGDHRQQRRRLGVDLAEARHEDERRHEEDSPAQAEETGDHAGGGADEGGLDHPMSSFTATRTRNAAKPSEIAETGTRCCNATPARTPPSAGTPTSAASSGWRFP